MKGLLFGLLFIFALIQSGCESENNENATISAKITWSEDVKSINMEALGIETTDILQNNIYELVPGEGTISWESEGVMYSKTINVRNSGIEDSENDIECEQEGEHEGENEGCVFSFSYSGNELSISNQ